MFPDRRHLNQRSLLHIFKFQRHLARRFRWGIIASRAAESSGSLKAASVNLQQQSNTIVSASFLLTGPVLPHSQPLLPGVATAWRLQRPRAAACLPERVSIFRVSLWVYDTKTYYVVITDYKGILQLHVPTPVLEGLHIWEVFGSRCEGFVGRPVSSVSDVRRG